MKISKLFKLFLFSICFVVLSLPSLAEIQFSNILDKIVIDEDVNKNYNLNLVFEDKFNGNAFMQKRQNGSYYVFVPDTAASSKNIKIVYQDGKDKSNIKIKVEESVYQKDDTDTAYVKLDVNIIGDYTIQLFSKTIDEVGPEPISAHFNWGKLICTIILLLACMVLARLISASQRNTNRKSGIISPYPLIKTDLPITLMSAAERSLLESKQERVRESRADELSQIDIRKAMRSSDNDSFSCFDIPANEEDNEYQDIEINSKIKQPTISLYEKTLKSKVTSPISNIRDEASEFEMPLVDDNKSNIINREIKRNEPELLSELRITPTKGFYLTTTNDNFFALFGFVGANVFLLKKFSDLSQINLQARFYDRQKDSDLYIVRLDSYKAMVEISDTGIKELAVL